MKDPLGIFTDPRTPIVDNLTDARKCFLELRGRDGDTDLSILILKGSGKLESERFLCSEYPSAEKFYAPESREANDLPFYVELICHVCGAVNKRGTCPPDQTAPPKPMGYAIPTPAGIFPHYVVRVTRDEAQQEADDMNRRRPGGAETPEVRVIPLYGPTELVRDGG